MTSATGRPLAARSALVTGASRGIGAAVARALAGAGAQVALLARDVQAAEDVAAQIGTAAHVVPGDLSDPAALRGALDSVRAQFGGAPDIVVNNAGAFHVAAAAETPVNVFRSLLDVNLAGPFAVVREVLDEMRVRGSGHLVGIGSVADRVAFPGNSAYAASKFGLRALHEVLRAELRGSGVRVTLVSPGPVSTDLWEALDPDTRAGFPSRSAMLNAADVAEAVYFAVTAPVHVNVDELRLSRS